MQRWRPFAAASAAGAGAAKGDQGVGSEAMVPVAVDEARIDAVS